MRFQRENANAQPWSAIAIVHHLVEMNESLTRSLYYKYFAIEELLYGDAVSAHASCLPGLII
ncbi:hypothetical protein [Aliidiomarina sp.]|uniref:hypothetical protein n=1 Tax=Aliidiomarina sp. TaxID=1872439 RepID=UPI003A4D9F57